jgi:hypothetical protein
MVRKKRRDSNSPNWDIYATMSSRVGRGCKSHLLVICESVPFEQAMNSLAVDLGFQGGL